MYIGPLGEDVCRIGRSYQRTCCKARLIGIQEQQQRRERALTYEISRSKLCIACSDVVRVVGLEPTSLAALEPKSSMFTNFIIPA